MMKSLVLSFFRYAGGANSTPSHASFCITIVNLRISCQNAEQVSFAQYHLVMKLLVGTLHLTRERATHHGLKQSISNNNNKKQVQVSFQKGMSQKKGKQSYFIQVILSTGSCPLFSPFY